MIRLYKDFISVSVLHDFSELKLKVHCMSLSVSTRFRFLFICSTRLGLMVCVLFPGGRKRKGWAKRRRRQSGTKSSLKTLPKEDDSDDACEKSLFVFVFCSQSPSAIKLIPSIFPSQGLISSSESSDGDDSDPESSNSGDSTFSEDINKMVKWITLVSFSDKGRLVVKYENKEGLI